MTTVQQAGKKGGSVKSEAKAKAVRENAKKPRGKLVTAISFMYICDDGKERSGVIIKRGKLSENAVVDAIYDSWHSDSWPIAEIAEIETVSERLVL